VHTDIADCITSGSIPCMARICMIRLWSVG